MCRLLLQPPRWLKLKLSWKSSSAAPQVQYRNILQFEIPLQIPLALIFSQQLQVIFCNVAPETHGSNWTCQSLGKMTGSRFPCKLPKTTSAKPEARNPPMEELRESS